MQKTYKAAYKAAHQTSCFIKPTDSLSIHNGNNASTQEELKVNTFSWVYEKTFVLEPRLQPDLLALNTLSVNWKPPCKLGA